MCIRDRIGEGPSLLAKACLFQPAFVLLEALLHGPLRATVNVGGDGGLDTFIFQGLDPAQLAKPRAVQSVRMRLGA
eukprot:844417-Pyramimonas_sp.AAC.1